MMDAETIQEARKELNELRKKSYRGPHPQKHLFLYFDWMEKKIADDAAQDVTILDKIESLKGIHDKEFLLLGQSLLIHNACINDIFIRLSALESAISKKETA